MPDFPKSYKARKGPFSGLANSRRRGRAFSSRKGETPASTGIRFFEMLVMDATLRWISASTYTAFLGKGFTLLQHI
jgi:hypothetical protein